MYNCTVYHYSHSVTFIAYYKFGHIHVMIAECHAGYIVKMLSFEYKPPCTVLRVHVSQYWLESLCFIIIIIHL